MYLCIYVSMYLCIYVSMYLCIYVSILYLCIHLSVCLSVCLSVSCISPVTVPPFPTARVCLKELGITLVVCIGLEGRGWHFLAPKHEPSVAQTLRPPPIPPKKGCLQIGALKVGGLALLPFMITSKLVGFPLCSPCFSLFPECSSKTAHPNFQKMQSAEGHEAAVRPAAHPARSSEAARSGPPGGKHGTRPKGSLGQPSFPIHLQRSISRRI